MRDSEVQNVQVHTAFVCSHVCCVGRNCRESCDRNKDRSDFSNVCSKCEVPKLFIPSHTKYHHVFMSESDSVTKFEPGWALIDTACTLSLIGNETAELWEQHLNRVHHLQSLEASDVNVRFRGLNGESRSSTAKMWPFVIGKQLGGLTTAVVPGSVPCLISLEVMKKMSMVIHTAENVVQVVVNGREVKLTTKFTPEGHLAVNLWCDLKQPQNCKFALVATDQKQPEQTSETTPKPSIMSKDEHLVMKALQAIARDSTESTVSQAYLDRLSSTVEVLVLHTHFSDKDCVQAAVVAYKPIVIRQCPSHICATHVLMLAVHEGILCYPFGKQWNAISSFARRHPMKQRYSLVFFMFARLHPVRDSEQRQSVWKPTNPNRRRPCQSGFVATLARNSTTKLVYPPGLTPCAEGTSSYGRTKPRQREVSRAAGTTRVSSHTGKQSQPRCESNDDMVGLQDLQEQSCADEQADFDHQVLCSASLCRDTWSKQAHKGSCTTNSERADPNATVVEEASEGGTVHGGREDDFGACSGHHRGKASQDRLCSGVDRTRFNGRRSNCNLEDEKFIQTTNPSKKRRSNASLQRQRVRTSDCEDETSGSHDRGDIVSNQRTDVFVAGQNGGEGEAKPTVNSKRSGDLTATAAEDPKTSKCNEAICGSCSANVFHVSLETLQNSISYRTDSGTRTGKPQSHTSIP